MEKFRFYALIVSFVSSVVLLQACGGGGGDAPASGGGGPVVPAGVSLNTVGNKIVAPGTALNFTISASNPDNNAVSLSVDLSQVTGATFNSTNGQFSWMPLTEGAYQVTFTVTNNDVDPVVSDSETITINVSSRVQLLSIGNQTVGPGGTINFVVSAFNPDNNSVSLSADLSQATGATFNSGNGQFSWTPSVEGNHQVIFTVTDNEASPVVTDSETITSDVSSRVQLNTIGDKTVGPGGTLNFTVSALNPDGNSISFSTNDTHPIYASQGAIFDSGTREFSWSPTVLGTHQITFTVTNDDVSPAAIVSETITIDVSNRVQLNPIGSKSVTQNGTLNFTVTASNPDNNSITLSTDTGHIIYTAQNAMFTQGTGQFSWTPASPGNHMVSFTVTNNDVGVTDSETISINVQDGSAILAEGAALYVTHCLRCHGPNGAGGQGYTFGVVGTSPYAVKEALGIVGNAAASSMNGIRNNMSNQVSDSNKIGWYLCDLDGITYTNTTDCPVDSPF